jgi:hypothetical protein
MRTLMRRFALWLLGWVDACPSCGAAWSEHACPQTAKLLGRHCGICDQPLPVGTVKTHHGKWRCRAHKEVL